jgi:arginase
MSTARPFTFIGAPIDSVGRSGGTEHSPRILRELGLVDVLGGPDAGDLHISIRGEERDAVTGIVGSDDVLTCTGALRDAARTTIGDGQRPFIVGGCCAALPGALAGARDATGRVGLAYLDGHLDLYDGVTSPTGEAADMPVAVALGLGPDRWIDAAGGPSVTPADTAILGYRDLEESIGYGMVHPDSLSGLVHHSNLDVRADADAIGDRVAAHLEQTAGAYWLHLDVDILDEEEFPATDYLSPDGLLWPELIRLMTPLARSAALIGASIGCYNPEKDPRRADGAALVAGLRKALG